MRSGPLIRTVHPLLTQHPPHPITQGRVGGTASHAVNIFLLTQTLSRIGDTAPSLPHQPHRRMTSPPPAAAQHHLHFSPRCCTTHHILLVGLPGSSKWPPLCTTLPILQSLSITHGCLSHLHHSLAATLLISARFDRLLDPPVWVAPPLGKTLSQSRVGSQACYSVELPALHQDPRHHPS